MVFREFEPPSSQVPLAEWVASGVVGGVAWAAVQATAADVYRRLRPHRSPTRLEARALALDCLRHHYGTKLAVKVTGEARGGDGTWTIDANDQDGSSSYSVEVPTNPAGPEELAYQRVPRIANP